MSKSLLIGGRANGRWEDCENMPVRRIVSVIRSNAPFPEVASDWVVEDYEAHRFRSGSEEWLIYIIQGMQLEDAFQMLLDNYKP